MISESTRDTRFARELVCARVGWWAMRVGYGGAEAGWWWWYGENVM